jgi:hypothetical protein
VNRWISRSLRLPAAAAGTLLATSSTAAITRTPAPPSSLAPQAQSVQVRVKHRHRAVRECIQLPLPSSCVGREAEGDTAAVIEFERLSVVNASLHPRSALRVAFPHRNGPQAQAIELGVGDWLIDWRGSERIERLQVKAGAQPQVTLTTTSGSCERIGARCVLVPGVRARRLTIGEGG